MAEPSPDEERLRFVAAKIGDVVGGAQRDAADTIATGLCTDPEFFERHGDRERACRRLAAIAYESANDEVEAILDDHRLTQHSDEIEEAAIDALAHGLLGVVDEFDGAEDERAVAEAIRQDGFGTADSLEESLQMTFDVWVVDPVDAERLREGSAQITRDRSGAAYQLKQPPQENSIPAKLGRTIVGALSGVGGIFR